MTPALERQAIDEAYAAQLALLFKVLCSNLALLSSERDAVQNFTRGLDNVRTAYTLACGCLPPPPS